MLYVPIIIINNYTFYGFLGIEVSLSKDGNILEYGSWRYILTISIKDLLAKYFAISFHFSLCLYTNSNNL